MEGEADKKVLAALDRFGPLSGKALAAMVGEKSFSYVKNRLKYLRVNRELIDKVPYVGVWSGNRCKKICSLYFLTEKGMGHIGREMAEVRPPRESKRERYYRASVMLTALFEKYPLVDLKTAKELRDKQLPHTLSARFVLGKAGIYFPAYNPNKKGRYSTSWIKTCAVKLQAMGVSQTVVVAANRSHRQKLLRSYIDRLLYYNVHIILPDEIEDLLNLDTYPKPSAMARMEKLMGSVKVKQNLVSKPALSVWTDAGNYYAVDATTFSLGQLCTIEFFTPESAVRDGMRPTLLMLVRNHEAAKDLAEAFPNQAGQMGFIATEVPLQESVFTVNMESSKWSIKTAGRWPT